MNGFLFARVTDFKIEKKTLQMYTCWHLEGDCHSNGRFNGPPSGRNTVKKKFPPSQVYTFFQALLLSLEDLPYLSTG